METLLRLLVLQSVSLIQAKSMVMTKSHAFSVVSDEHAKKIDEKDFAINQQNSSETEANKKKSEK